MAANNIKVKNCRDCPFSQTDSNDGSGFCACPGENEVYSLNFDNDESAPDNCPLRVNDVKIEL